jgi:hypothetical protein
MRSLGFYRKRITVALFDAGLQRLNNASRVIKNTTHRGDKP